MTKIFIDVEFNDFEGELISLALVSETGEEFYEVLPCDSPTSWVAENVITKLQKGPITKGLFEYKLQEFLNMFDDITIIADWPDDIKHFCESLIIGPSVAITHPPISFILDRTLSSESSTVLHNALYDARAIFENYMENKRD